MVIQSSVLGHLQHDMVALVTIKSSLSTVSQPNLASILTTIHTIYHTNIIKFEQIFVKCQHQSGNFPIAPRTYDPDCSRSNALKHQVFVYTGKVITKVLLSQVQQPYCCQQLPFIKVLIAISFEFHVFVCAQYKLSVFLTIKYQTLYCAFVRYLSSVGFHTENSFLTISYYDIG